MSTAPSRLIDYLKLAHEFLEAKGISGARLDSELLLAEVLGLSRVELYTNHDRPLSEPEVSRFRELLRRRAAREPVAYILGRREFWSLDLEVDRRVLIPRPETELLVETAIRALGGDLEDSARTPFDQVRNMVKVAEARVLDIGTGSGAVAVALAVEGANLRVVATDHSHASLEVAPRNAERHGVEARIEFRHGDLFAAVSADEKFDLIVSNPPYVKASEVDAMEPEVKSWEPTTALVSGDDGMTTTRRMIDGAAAHLSADGWLLIEVGTQSSDVRKHFEASGWRNVTTMKDLASRDRVVAARPPALEGRG